MNIQLAKHYHPEYYVIIPSKIGVKSIVIQTDWDYPGIASTFGWVPCAECRSTDGTVACEHHSVSEMIESAAEYLDEHLGDMVEDPGYFV